MKSSILLFLLSVAVGYSILIKKPVYERELASEYKEDSIAEDGLQRLSYKDLKEIILSEKIKTVEELIEYLGKHFAEYLRFHTLMYNSLSLHESSFEEPRVIVFGPDARFVITFNGNQNQRAGHAVEVMEFSEKSQSFEFREIEFKSQKGESFDLPLTEDEIEFENSNVLFSKPNPKKCLACHGPNANPIWATYFVWPGAYGSNDDQLTMSFDSRSWNPNNIEFFKQATRPHSQGRSMRLKDESHDSELEGLGRYVQAKETHPRYKWLPEQFYEKSLIKYMSGTKFKDLDVSVQAIEEAKKYGKGFWPSRPNLFFQVELMDLNQLKLINDLKKLMLENAFASEAWIDWFPDTPSRLNLAFVNIAKKMEVDFYLDDTSEKMEKFLKNFEAKSSWPNRNEIKDRLRKNLLGEIRMQTEKMNLHASSLGVGKDGLVPFHIVPIRIGMEEVGDPIAFYSGLLQKTELENLDQIAFVLETSHLPTLTLIAILLEDRGLNLESYSMNMRQMGLSFHTGGLDEVTEFLGIPRYL